MLGLATTAAWWPAAATAAAIDTTATDASAELRAAALDAFAARDFDTTLALLDELVSREPREPRWREMRADALVDNKRFEAALDDFGAALSLTPSDAGIDRAAEGGGEFGAGFGDEGEAVTGLEAVGEQAVGHRLGVVAQFGEGVGADEMAARIVEIEAAAALGGIIERIAEGGEIGVAARQVAQAGGGAGRGSRWFAGGRSGLRCGDVFPLCDQVGPLREQGGVGHGLEFPSVLALPAGRYRRKRVHVKPRPGFVALVPGTEA